MNWKQVCALGIELPEVSESLWYRMPSLAVRGKSFAGYREEIEAMVVRLESTDEQARLIAAHPSVYYITEHYAGYASVLVRLATLKPPECRLRLERAWRLTAPKSIVKRFDAPR
jgi:hypothetical protein